MKKKFLLFTTLALTLATSSCSDDILDNQETFAQEKSINTDEVISGLKSWFYSNYIELSENSESINTEEQNNQIRSQNKIIFGADLNWDQLTFYGYEDYYLLHIPMFNSEIKSSFSSDMNMRGYADLTITYDRKRKEYKPYILEIHPDKAYMKARGLDATKEMFMEYRRVKTTDPDFTGYVYYKEIDGTSVSLYRIVNGKLVN